MVPARTGGFGEMTCAECHSGNPPNDAAGRLTLDGVPEAYAPGERYTVRVTLRRPGLVRGGVQLTAREGGINMSAGADAGWLSPADERMETVQGERGVTYLQQTRSGTRAQEPGAATWTFTWTAPEAERPVAFHVAAIASDADGSPSGDVLYTLESRTRAESP